MGALSFGLNVASYYEWAKKGRLYVAYASVSAPVIYSTAAGTGGPLLWNNSAATGNAVNAVILACACGDTTATTVATTLGLTGNSGQTSAPTTTTAIGVTGSVTPGIGPATPRCNTYAKGTVTNSGNFFLQTHLLDTGAVNTVTSRSLWVDVGGVVVVPPGSWCALAAGATATSAVVGMSLLWAEVPLD